MGVSALDKMLCLVAGSAVGGVARWFLIDFAARNSKDLPWGTLIVNLSGCLLLGVLHGMGDTSWPLGPRTKMLLMVGFCGAFTTFSTWMLESSILMEKGASRAALAYIVLSVALGFALLRVGAAAARTALAPTRTDFKLD